ncbi:hypothetical protein OPQ81_002202 [Rhizoctonia solani]|nr:hypothetical protein OPQ81_002202 [Rhizoctonia solani]
MVMASELVGWKKMLGMADYSEGAKTMRRYIHHSISARTSSDWLTQQEQEALRFLQKLLRSPENLISHIRQTSGATVVRLTYGYTPKDQDDEYIKIAERAMENFALVTTPGMFLVDIFPLLKHIPWTPFKRIAAEWRNQLSDLIDIPMAFVHDQMSRGLAQPSFVSEWLEEPSHASDKALIPVTAAALYAGGADTIVSAISTFFVAMLHYPEAQKLAQKEIDDVLGKNRLPTLADRYALPYVDALCKEILRWQPVGPIGIPHRLGSDIDDEYKGMRIPAHSMVIANIWKMLRDPDVYQRPDTFEPSRYLGKNPEPNPEDVAFGFGKRRCPGINVARSSLWLTVALTLTAYNVTPFIGEDGKPILPSLEYTNATVRHPKPFRCHISPRSEQLRKIIGDISL